MKNLLEELIDADIAFSKLSVEQGVMKSFSKYLVKDAVILPQSSIMEHGTMIKGTSGEITILDIKGKLFLLNNK